MLNKDSKFEYFAIKPQSTEKEVTLKRNISDFRLPFKGEWYVVWGGDTKEQNYHVDTRSQKHAFDILKLDSTGKTHSGDGSKNENYYAYGKDIIAPISGKVVKVIDGVPDNKPGEMNPFMAVGNCIIIKTKHNEYLFCAISNLGVFW